MPNFVSFAASVAELAHGEKLRTQSISHSPSLFDVPGTEVFALEYGVYCIKRNLKQNRIELSCENCWC